MNISYKIFKGTKIIAAGALFKYPKLSIEINKDFSFSPEEMGYMLNNIKEALIILQRRDK